MNSSCIGFWVKIQELCAWTLLLATTNVIFHTANVTVVTWWEQCLDFWSVIWKLLIILRNMTHPCEYNSSYHHSDDNIEKSITQGDCSVLAILHLCILFFIIGQKVHYLCKCNSWLNMTKMLAVLCCTNKVMKWSRSHHYMHYSFWS